MAEGLTYIAMECCHVTLTACSALLLNLLLAIRLCNVAVAGGLSGGKDRPFSQGQVESAFQKLTEHLRLDDCCWVASPPDGTPSLISAGPSLRASEPEQGCGSLLGTPSQPTPVQLMQGSSIIEASKSPPPAPSLQYRPWQGTAMFSLSIGSLNVLALPKNHYHWSFKVLPDLSWGSERLKG